MPLEQDFSLPHRTASLGFTEQPPAD